MKKLSVISCLIISTVICIHTFAATPSWDFVSTHNIYIKPATGPDATLYSYNIISHQDTNKVSYFLNAYQPNKQLKWSFRILYQPYIDDAVSKIIVGQNGMIYLATKTISDTTIKPTITVYAFTPDTHKVIWSTVIPTSHRDDSFLQYLTLAPDGKALYFYYEKKLRKLNTGNGAIVQTGQLSFLQDKYCNGLTIGEDGTTYIMAYTAGQCSNIYIVSPDWKTLEHSFHPFPQPGSDLKLLQVKNKIIYITGLITVQDVSQFYIYAIDCHNKTVWKHKLKNGVSYASGGKDGIYIAVPDDVSGRKYALKKFDFNTGDVKATIELSGFNGIYQTFSPDLEHLVVSPDGLRAYVQQTRGSYEVPHPIRAFDL